MSIKLSATDNGGYLFDCPGCKMTHVVYVTTPERPRWTFNGDMERPTFSPSLHVTWTQWNKQQVCHSFVRDGRIQFLGDCTHEHAGKTLEIPNWDD